MSEEEADEFLARLRPLLLRLRQDSNESLDFALASYESDMGGVLKIQMPCRAHKRTLPEAAFRTERYDEIG